MYEEWEEKREKQNERKNVENSATFFYTVNKISSFTMKRFT